MVSFSFVLLYVNSVPASATFYAGLLDRPAVEQSENFAMVPLGGGAMLGLWARHDVAPASAAPAGGGELAMSVADAAAVDAVHADWVARGLPILQAPSDMDFGRTFCAADPDGHRLRVFAPPAG